MHDADFPVKLRAAQAGDELAFAELFRAVQPQLLRYLGAVTHTLADGTADDVAAETWVQVVRGLDRFRGDEQGFRAWVFTIGRAKLVDARRRSGRLPVPDDVEQRLAEVGVPSAEEEVEQLMTTEQALALIGSLPAKHAEVVLLRYVAGFDVRETARMLGKKDGAVRVTAHRALRRLEEILDGSAEHPRVTQPPSESVREVR